MSSHVASHRILDSRQLGCSMQLDQNAALNNDGFRINSISVATYKQLDCHLSVYLWDHRRVL